MARAERLQKLMKTTPINQHQGAERSPIGFGREKETTVVTLSDSPSGQCSIVCISRAELENTIILVVKGYMEERSKRCYKEGLDRELMAKLDKIFVKYFETIA